MISSPTQRAGCQLNAIVLPLGVSLCRPNQTFYWWAWLYAYWKVTGKETDHFQFIVISAVWKWTFKWDLLGNFKICHIFCLNCRKVRKLFDMVEWVFCFLFPLQDFCQRWDTNFKTEGENWGKKYTIVNVSLTPVSIAVWRFRTSDQNKRLLQFFGDDLYPYFCDRNTLLHVFHTCFSLL